MSLQHASQIGPFYAIAAARQTVARQQEHVCGWCLERGAGTLIYVNGRMILSSHAQCMTNGAVDQAAQCACLDPVHPGNSPVCPVPGHGGEKC